ncbi:MAG: 16S rRNA (adenine1518-N6/adenine1519-N6)-dimethyltransferase [Parcubacteria bacterium C7867-004]|nr:MAG: 16S rRNA (adenine1518-N6/adenine1519-N6)-dimethyltransferase [Parcubacteria bacterium C7867-004]
MFAKKSLGQNFLMHQQTADRIVAAAGLAPGDTVLEVGPGTGMLTRALLASGAQVIAVEADHALIETLEGTFAPEIGEGRLTLSQGDIRNFDAGSIPKPYAVVANIPYYITGEIIRQFLTANNQPSSMTLLVQKEVAERIARSKKESLLSLSVKAYGTPSYVFTVPRGAFRPAPNVDSAVLHIRDISKESFSDSAREDRFFEVLHAGFAHKRKQLGNNLEDLASKKAVADALAAAGIAPTVRAEDLSLSTWLALATKI